MQNDQKIRSPLLKSNTPVPQFSAKYSQIQIIARKMLLFDNKKYIYMHSESRLRACLYQWSEPARFSGLVSFVFKLLERKNKRNQPAEPGWLTSYIQALSPSFVKLYSGAERNAKLRYLRGTVCRVQFVVYVKSYV